MRKRLKYLLKINSCAKKMQIARNISKLMQEFNVDDKRLSDATGVSAATIKKMRLGQSPNPTVETLVPLAKFFDVSVSQLIGEISLDDNNNDKKNIPLLSWRDIETKDIKALSVLSHVLLETNEPENCFATQVLSDKYQSPFNKDTILIINTKTSPNDGDYILCQFNNQLEICQIISQLGQKHIVSMVSGMQTPTKLDSLEKYIGTIIETRNILQLEKPSISHKNNIIQNILSLTPIKISLN